MARGAFPSPVPLPPKNRRKTLFALFGFATSASGGGVNLGSASARKWNYPSRGIPLSAARARWMANPVNLSSVRLSIVESRTSSTVRCSFSDEAFHVGGDNGLRGLLLLRLHKRFADRGDGACGGDHGCLLLGFWLLHFRVEKRHVRAERHLAKAGGQGARGGVSPPERSAGGQRPVCTSEARKIGKPLVAARSGRSPLASG
jgi:hypothetical protein